ncbi:MAG: hypothetical protein NUV90_00130 [Candidatus Parcubacteria bacterium]|nr:hypothetical protein [Candidatus Parcubacteria bacterium]
MRTRNRNADADEAFEPVESIGISVATHNSVEPTKCLGYACPMPSDTCNICKLFKGDTVFPFYQPFTESRVFQSRNAGLHELYAAAPASRGSHTFVELHVYGRMKF